MGPLLPGLMCLSHSWFRRGRVGEKQPEAHMDSGSPSSSDTSGNSRMWTGDRVGRPAGGPSPRL